MCVSVMCRICVGHVWDMRKTSLACTRITDGIYLRHLGTLFGTCLRHVSDKFGTCLGDTYMGQVLDMVGP